MNIKGDEMEVQTSFALGASKKVVAAMKRMMKAQAAKEFEDYLNKGYTKKDARTWPRNCAVKLLSIAVHEALPALLKGAKRAQDVEEELMNLPLKKKIATPRNFATKTSSLRIASTMRSFVEHTR